jgi:diadenosine tetraphosphate (Ap4A) HIT family hydrolase
MTCYKKNPLTKEYGLYSPKKHNPNSKRPLPVIQDKVKPCMLCKEVKNSKNQKTITNTPNPNPLARNHNILLWKKHKEKTQTITRKEWKKLLKQIKRNTSKKPKMIAYANLGENSGASEKHLHAHTLKLRNAINETKQLKKNNCVICKNKTPTVKKTKHHKIQYVPGGRHGEIIVVNRKHGKHVKKISSLAKTLSDITQQYNKYNITSFKIVVHPQKHAHIHVYPSYSAEGGLEVSGISVSRYSKKQVKKIINKYNNKNKGQ